MAVELARRRFTVDEYYRMAEVGILSHQERVELVDGEIVEMSPIGSWHAACVAILNRLFSRLLGDRAVLWVQNPVRLGPRSEPEPDVCLLRPPLDSYRKAHPVPEDVLLLIEVADTTLQYDRSVKVPMYARAGIREVWIIDLAGDAVLIYRTPSPEGYLREGRVGRGGSFAPEAFPDATLAVDDILGH